MLSSSLFGGRKCRRRGVQVSVDLAREVALERSADLAGGSSLGGALLDSLSGAWSRSVENHCRTGPVGVSSSGCGTGTSTHCSRRPLSTTRSAPRDGVRVLSRPSCLPGRDRRRDHR